MELADRYCPYCSQANTTKHLSVRDFFEEFLAEIVNLDTRLIRTLKTMIWRPGAISLEFIEGRRKSYANPFRLLLSVAIIYFLMLTFSGDFDSMDRSAASETDVMDRIPDLNLSFDSGDRGPEEILAGLDSAQLKTLDSLGLRNLDKFSIKALDSLGLKGLDSLSVEGLDSRTLTSIDSLGLREGLKAAKLEKDSILLSNPRAYLDSIHTGSWSNRMFRKATFFLTLIDKDGVYTYEEAVEKHGLPVRGEDRIAFGIADSMDHVIRQPGSFFKEFISTVPFAIFFFLPLFTVVLWLVYIRKSYTYTDNLVFSFHTQSFFFILLIISFLIDRVFGVLSIGYAILVFSVYLFLSMRRFYGQGWFKTTLKYFFLNTVFIILASMAAVIFLIGSALTF
jgi:hypothetical protein